MVRTQRNDEVDHLQGFRPCDTQQVELQQFQLNTCHLLQDDKHFQQLGLGNQFLPSQQA